MSALFDKFGSAEKMLSTSKTHEIKATDSSGREINWRASLTQIKKNISQSWRPDSELVEAFETKMNSFVKNTSTVSVIYLCQGQETDPRNIFSAVTGVWGTILAKTKTVPKEAVFIINLTRGQVSATGHLHYQEQVTAAAVINETASLTKSNLIKIEQENGFVTIRIGLPKGHDKLTRTENTHEA